MGSISMKELLHEAPYNKDDRNTAEPATGALLDNANLLIRRVNALLRHWAAPVRVSSGYRPGSYNKAAGGAVNSAHMTCEAVDISDPEGKLGQFVSENEWLLIKNNLYMEHVDDTKRRWVHLQTRPTKSGKRIFKK